MVKEKVTKERIEKTFKSKLSELLKQIPSIFSSKNRVVVIVAFLVIASFALYFFLQYQKSQSLLKNPNQASTEEAKALVDQVAKLIELPVGESPTVATVSDKTKLQDQPFFAKAENGDKVLIYTNAKKAILFRPSINKIIEVAPVNVGTNTNPQVTSAPSSNSQAVSTPTVTPTQKTLKVTIYNGTKTGGLAQSAATKLSAGISNLDITQKADAVGQYTRTLVIDLTGTNAQSLSQFTNIVGGKTQTTVPDGEVKPNADILIILGTDYSSK